MPGRDDECRAAGRRGRAEPRYERTVTTDSDWPVPGPPAPPPGPGDGGLRGGRGEPEPEQLGPDIAVD